MPPGDHIFQGLGHLIPVTNGWTNEAVDEYVAKLADCTDTKAFAAACDHLGSTWDQLHRPPVSAIREAYRAELAKRPAVVGGAQCDGSGWTRENHPCPRCSPALHDAWSDPGKWAMYLDGAGLDELDVGVERVKGVLRYASPRPIPKCSSAQEVPAKPDAGRARLMAGYEAECKQQGRQPSTKDMASLFPRPT